MQNNKQVVYEINYAFLLALSTNALCKMHER